MKWEEAQPFLLYMCHSSNFEPSIVDVLTEFWATGPRPEWLPTCFPSVLAMASYEATRERLGWPDPITTLLQKAYDLGILKDSEGASSQ